MNKKNSTIGIIILFIILSLILLIFLKPKKINEDNTIKQGLDNQAQKEEEKADDTGNDFTEVNTLLFAGKYEDVISMYEEKGIGNLSRDEKIKLIAAYLGQGNYYYQEEEFSKKAMDILNTMPDDYTTFYYKGYSQEIIKVYSGAIDYYDKGLELTNTTDVQKAVLLNQKGHLYDLQGNTKKALDSYKKAHDYDKNNIEVLSNMGRSYARNGDYKKAIQYLEELLDKELSSPMRAEIYFSLSSLELEIGRLKPDVNKSIDYARKAIAIYPNYPNGYVALARGLYMRNDSTFDKEITDSLDKAIELNPNGYYAYELYGLHKYDKGDFEGFLNMFMKADEAIAYDMILMDNQKEDEKNLLNFKYYILNEIQKNKEDTEGMYVFINNLIGMPAGKPVILQQIKREGYGIFGFLSGDKEMTELIEKLK